MLHLSALPRFHPVHRGGEYKGTQGRLYRTRGERAQVSRLVFTLYACVLWKALSAHASLVRCRMALFTVVLTLISLPFTVIINR
jgi:hypothetical protein